MQIIYFLWDHCANVGNVENREPHKPTFGGGPSSAVQTILLLSKTINKTESPVFVHLFVFFVKEFYPILKYFSCYMTIWISAVHNAEEANQLFGILLQIVSYENNPQTAGVQQLLVMTAGLLKITKKY